MLKGEVSVLFSDLKVENKSLALLSDTGISEIVVREPTNAAVL